eukprot:TRINITY_DN24940_c0_g1_i9.p3 TRINITY_DN24940_c0_g1~~TRINITY_DN24940_c0_g1_i9.p3  ORF type:complete len:101 (+),score=0.31 TRINITY_DN24940_c0_g1_i9:389-691(+)
MFLLVFISFYFHSYFLHVGCVEIFVKFFCSFRNIENTMFRKLLENTKQFHKSPKDSSQVKATFPLVSFTQEAKISANNTIVQLPKFQHNCGSLSRKQREF